TALTDLNCSSNQLTSLNVANGNNAGSSIDATNNPNLTCIQVDNVAYSTGFWTDIDAAASFSLDCGYVVNIPNANFKAYLVGNTAINTNSDTEIQVSEATAFTGTINCQGLSISDLTGIEAFTALTDLFCRNNAITTLDLSQNTVLTTLDCRNNSITTLNISQNSILTSLDCGYNSLTALDVSSNTALTILKCLGNSLTNLNVSSNVNLLSLLCNSNVLTSLTLTQNINLTLLQCEYNQLTNLDVANGSNTNFTYFSADHNPNLTCIQVDNVAYSTSSWGNIDATASFSLNCSVTPCTVNIPDANFKAYLIGNTAINTNLDTEIQCAEATAFAGTINCGTSTITDLTGIEEFVNLTVLLCSNNPLASVDLSQNIALTEISFLNNNLSVINLSTNTQLTYVEVSGNSLSSLDISMLTNLTQLWAKNNGLSTLSLPSSSSITTLVLFQNNLTSLDLSLQSNLVALDIHTNNLSSLNVANSNNTNFSYFKTTTNPNLTCIEVDNVAYSTTNWTNIDATASFNTNCSSTVGVNEQADNLSLSIYPNPTANKLEIRNLKSPITNISIIDVTGKTVKTIIGNVSTVNVSELTRGIYFIQIQTEKGMVNSKFIKE
ncbi:MAG: T9SS type A sorting domain-containing protein, partial [Flavobacteriales bacterium]|nr:T9SS type A sorting domain-containing protein [Flavobacteriales bacterium]